MALSERGQEWAKVADRLLLWTILKDLWHPTDNPNGYVSLGVAENALMHKEMAKYVNEHVKLPNQGLTYGDGGGGSKKLTAAMARFLTRKLKPAVTIDPSHLVMTNGVTTGIEHLAFTLANPGDAILLGQPHYGAFPDDMELRPGAQVVHVSFGTSDPLAASSISAYERTIQTCHARNQRVAAIMLCNPHNPLGRCYPRSFLIDLMKLCSRHSIHLISDEIYALSIFRTSPAATPFTSVSSIPTANLIDPSLIHILYGLSKDFGANGLRIGCVVSQANPTLHKAFVPTVIYSYASSLAESITTTLVSDDAFVDWYVAENCRRLARNYDLVTAWADRWGFEYAKGSNAGFFLWVELGSKYSQAVEEGRIAELGQKKKESEDGQEGGIDAVVNEVLLGQKIFLAMGKSFGSERPGWFRIIFSQDEQNLREGLKRIERALGFGDVRAKL